MEHTTHTQIIFADSAEEAKAAYLASGVKPDDDPNARIDVCKASEEPDFDFDSPFNLIGEISLSPEYMDIIRKDPNRAYVIYFVENK